MGEASVAINVNLSSTPPLPVHLPLQDRVAIVTGGASGIGKAIALHLVSLGAKVVINYSSSSRQADQIIDQINTSHDKPRAVAVKADISDPEQVKSLFDAAESAFPGSSSLKIFVNSAGVVDPKYPSIMETSVEDFDWTFGINCRGAFICLKEAAKRLEKGGGGRIICVTTSLVQALKPRYGVYIPSKVAVETMVKILAKELKGTGITVNCVAPGPIATDQFFAGKTEEMVKRLVDECPLNRIGETKDVAPLVGFLASDSGEWVNGQIIRINGGFA